MFWLALAARFFTKCVLENGNNNLRSFATLAKGFVVEINRYNFVAKDTLTNAKEFVCASTTFSKCVFVFGRASLE